MVLKEACDVLDQECMRIYKVIIGIKYVSEIGRISKLEEYLQ